MSLTRTHEPVMDQNYNWRAEPIPPASRILALGTLIDAWEHKAAELDASADRWAAQGQHEAAARNLAGATEYRQRADQARQEIEQIKGESNADQT